MATDPGHKGRPMTRSALFIIAAVTLVVTAGGCVTTTFTLIAPVPAVVAADKPFKLALDPLRYEFITTDGRLIVKIDNPTDDTIQLIGPDSSAVDPDGRSHPLISQTLAARSFVKLVLPPPRPWGTGGPVVVGFVLSDYPGGARYGYPDAQPDEADAPEIHADDFNSPVYWDWSGNRPAVRLDLVFRRGQKTFDQQFVIRKNDR